VGLAYAGALVGFHAVRQPDGLWLAQSSDPRGPRANGPAAVIRRGRWGPPPRAVGSSAARGSARRITAVRPPLIGQKT
jgi:hypothetical protein